MLPPIPQGWPKALAAERRRPYFRRLVAFLESELAAGKTVLPDLNLVFRALELTPYDSVRVVLLGQDPYPTPGHAHGLSFSVRPEVRPLPGSLRNIYRELRDDLGIATPEHGCLESWARHGVLLLNAVLTVRAGEANSHQGRGWESFTDRVLDCLDQRPEPVVFLLWGRFAQKKRDRIRDSRHRVIEAAHPSPLSARRFLGCRCFSAVNRALAELGREPLDWRLPATRSVTP
ncbi:MAG: uracil-DNA glycosylase [Verrucomicrobiae bacterium]|nr:uracil-DNA glycosylase [Verrucomicrobiae bacterium]